MSQGNQLILANLIASRAEQEPDKVILIFENGNQADETRTYRELWQRGRQIAQALCDEGMEKGDFFAILLQNHPEFVDAMVGASITGAIFVPIDPRAREDKLLYMLRHSGCKGVICADYTLAALLDVRSRLPNLQWIWVLGAESAPARRLGDKRIRTLRDIYSSAVAAVETAVTDPAEPMEIMYTSGTTGDPKGVVISHARWGTVGSWHHWLGYRPDDRPYSGLSLTHGNAQLVTLACALTLGMCAVFSRKFTKNRLWDIARKYRCTVFNLLGGMTTAIYSEPPRPDDGDNPVRYVISSGMPAAIWEDFERRFKVDILEFYGAVEGGMMIKPVGEGPIGSIGKPPPFLKARLVDEYGADVPAGAQGEIIFQPADGSAPVVNYLYNPEASQKKVHGGWMRMEDIGHQDKNGWFFFDFRVGGAIRHNGEFINPALVEKILAESQAVSDVFVYGVKAASGAPGEKDVVAAIVPSPACGQNGPDIGALAALCRERLEANAVPAYFQILSEIPKTASEKPIERLLVGNFNAGLDNVHAAALLPLAIK
ncbi:MAG: AMP-binding protein [Azonexus sp.]|jgi:crotonobetaine/carnitine-CoA ligase|nr:AMP-binding protein [Azonexus sp.]